MIIKKSRNKIMFNALVSVLITLFLFQNASCFGQKKFTVTLQFPKEIDISKLTLAYDNGKTQISIPTSKFKDGKLTTSGLFYSKYAALIFRYPKNGHLNYGNSIFLSTEPAKIIFKNFDATSSPFDNYNLVNAYDFKTEKDPLKNNSLDLIKSLEDFIDSLGEKFAQQFDSTVREKWTNLNKGLFEKEMEFVSQNSHSYYAFWYFRRNLTNSPFITTDSTLHFFNTKFSDSYRNSEEGSTIKSLLNGKIMVKKGNIAPGFISKAMDGKIVSLKDYRGKKYVLLIFWATWCGPCTAEIPTLRDIRKEYSTSDLELISVSYNSTSFKSTEDFIKEKKMNWVNIYNDIDLINAWGGNKTIPRTYLIDKLGVIVYDKDVDDPGSLKLSKLKQYLNQLQIH